MTVGQFLKECSNYEYSKERYDLMKECAELELMEQFISDQKYMKENVMNDDYYSESVDDESLVLLEESFKEKLDGVIEKIKKAFIQLMEKFDKFVDMIVKKIRKTLMVKTVVGKILMKRDVDDEFIEELNDEVRKGDFTKQDFLNFVKVDKKYIKNPKASDDLNKMIYLICHVDGAIILENDENKIKIPNMEKVLKMTDDMVKCLESKDLSVMEKYKTEKFYDKFYFYPDADDFFESWNQVNLKHIKSEGLNEDLKKEDQDKIEIKSLLRLNDICFKTFNIYIELYRQYDALGGNIILACMRKFKLTTA